MLGLRGFREFKGQPELMEPMELMERRCSMEPQILALVMASMEIFTSTPQQTRSLVPRPPVPGDQASHSLDQRETKETLVIQVPKDRRVIREFKENRVIKVLKGLKASRACRVLRVM